MNPAWCIPMQDDCLMQLVVVPRASRTRVAGEHDGRLKLQIAAPPVDGEANEEVVRMLSELLGIARHQVELMSGDGARRKTVKIRGMQPAQVLTRLGMYA